VIGNLVIRSAPGSVLASVDTMSADTMSANTMSANTMSALNDTLLACPGCGASMQLFESFPARSGLPEVHVFECATCKEMILQDRSRHATAPHAPASG